MSSPTASVCVFCGSRTGVQPAYRAEAEALGHALAAEGWRLVYGAGDIGLMGAVADGVLEAGGHVTGVIPEFLEDKELGHRGVARCA